VGRAMVQGRGRCGEDDGAGSRPARVGRRRMVKNGTGRKQARGGGRHGVKSGAGRRGAASDHRPAHEEAAVQIRHEEAVAWGGVDVRRRRREEQAGDFKISAALQRLPCTAEIWLSPGPPLDFIGGAFLGVGDAPTHP
jgi:hypothetical protein